MEDLMLERAVHLVELALQEDLGERGDITSEAIFQDQQGEAIVITKQEGVIAGLFMAGLVFEALGNDVLVRKEASDGDRVTNGVVVLTLTGPVKRILAGERTLLNFLGRLSGIATSAQVHLQAQAGDLPILLDTRKTTPGYRLLEKYAVRAGGMQNHRLGLYDQYMIKDNHIAAAGGVTPALKQVYEHHRQLGADLPVEIEVCTVEQFAEAAPLSPDIIMLDHFDDEMIRAVKDIPHKGIQLELSGNVAVDRINTLTDSGIRFVSIGAVTHSAPAFDFSLRVEEK